MLNTTTVSLWISNNIFGIAIIIIGTIIVYKLYNHYNKNKKDILKKVAKIQTKYKLPKQP